MKAINIFFFFALSLLYSCSNDSTILDFNPSIKIDTLYTQKHTPLFNENSKILHNQAIVITPSNNLVISNSMQDYFLSIIKTDSPKTDFLNIESNDINQLSNFISNILEKQNLYDSINIAHSRNILNPIYDILIIHTETSFSTLKHEGDVTIPCIYITENKPFFISKKQYYNYNFAEDFCRNNLIFYKYEGVIYYKFKIKVMKNGKTINIKDIVYPIGSNIIYSHKLL